MDKQFVFRSVRFPAELDRALVQAKKERPYMTITALIVEAVAEKFLKGVTNEKNDIDVVG
jgi:hypothetical protein